jgi:predicted secreted Zn-dependent protease
MFKVTIKRQQQCVNVSMLLWQHVSILLDHLQASIQRYEVQHINISRNLIHSKLQFIFVCVQPDINMPNV